MASRKCRAQSRAEPASGRAAPRPSQRGDASASRCENAQLSQEQNQRADANRQGTERRREQLAANHADRQAAARARNESKPLTEAADCVLSNVHACSGSGITANSRRLASLGRAHGVDSDEYKEAKADTKADIKRFGNVTVDTELEAAILTCPAPFVVYLFQGVVRVGLFALGRPNSIWVGDCTHPSHGIHMTHPTRPPSAYRM